jgi:hypothetical protein
MRVDGRRIARRNKIAYIGAGMAELEKRISGDWIEIREKSNDLYTLLEALAVPSYEMKGAAERLRRSVEQGIVEFKRATLSPVLVALETARYRTIPADTMAAQEKALGLLLLAILVQRLLCTDGIPMARPPAAKRDFGVESLQVNMILADVNARVKANASLRTHTAVKNILMQVQRYNQENHKMRELLPAIKTEMRASFLSNFTRTFDEIIGSIRRQYLALLEEDAAAETARREGFSLALMPLKDLAPLLASQAKEVARFRSTLAHAREEKHKTRESLVHLYDGRQAVLKLIEEEPKFYRLICQRTGQASMDACSLSIAAGFRDEIVGILERQGKKDEGG